LYYPELKQGDKLVLAFNPSDSFDKSVSVIKILQSHPDKTIKDFFSSITDKASFKSFLSPKNLNQNEYLINVFQKCCHDNHDFFLKRKIFLKNIGYKSEELKFLDLFPIWSTKQKHLEDYLEKHRAIERAFVNLFIEVIEGHLPSEIIILNNGVWRDFKDYELINEKDEKIWKLGSVDKTLRPFYQQFKVRSGKINSVEYFCFAAAARFDQPSQLEIFSNVIKSR
jgi:hypothetical protein